MLSTNGINTKLKGRLKIRSNIQYLWKDQW